MEIKHTFEILAKDIQDIEKLVRNIQNSPKPASIELDLALSKMRNVYEVLLMIKADHISLPEETWEAEPAPEPGEATHAVQDLEEAEESFQVEEHIVEAETEADEPQTAEEPVKPKKEAGILAEKFDKESSLNENLGLKRSADMTSKLASQPIDSISRNIGINDRFFIIKELFKGDNEGYNAIIKNLDLSNNFNEAFSIIEKRFPDTLDHDGVQILVNLARRRFISSGNV